MVFAKKAAPALKSAKIESKGLLYGIVSECFRSPRYAEALSTALAVSLLREYSAAAAKPKRRPGELPHAKLVRAVQYIQDQLDTNLTISGIAQTVGMSPCYFTRLFKSILNDSRALVP
jgi:transcriptional regulator GlxA family with amidase domain